MHLRRLATGLLIFFVIFTCGFAVGKEVGVRRMLANLPPQANPEGQAASDAERPARRIDAWYFHGTKRCLRCNTIEAYGKEAVETLFPERAADGTITWQTANMEDVWHADTVRRYGLVRSSLVLADVRDGVEHDHVVLSRAWDFTDDKETFLAYVESELEMILDAWAENDAADEGEE